MMTESSDRHFHGSFRSVLAILACVVAYGCTSIPADRLYSQPLPDQPAATVVNWGSVIGTAGTCGFPGSGRICRAWIGSVEGKLLHYEDNEVRVQPGPHSFALACNYASGLPPFLGALQSVIMVYEGTFEADRKYYVRCIKGDDRARVWLAATAEGEASPEFVFQSYGN